MSWTVFLRQSAEDDIETARAFYEKVQSGLGEAFLDDVAQAVRGLQSNPQWTRLYYRNFRRVLLKRFPYAMIYLLDDSRVVIFRLLHGRRDFPRWLPK